MFHFLKYCRLCVFGWTILVAAMGTRVLVEAVRMRRSRGGEGHATAWVQLMDDVAALGPTTEAKTAQLVPAVAAAVAAPSNVSSLPNPSASTPFDVLPSSSTLNPSNPAAIVAAPKGFVSGEKIISVDSLEKTPLESLKEVAENTKNGAVGESTDAEESTEEATDGTTGNPSDEKTGDTPDGTLENSGKAVEKTPSEGRIPGSAAERATKETGNQTVEANATKSAEEAASTLTKPSIVQSGTTSATLLIEGSTAPGTKTIARGATIQSTRDGKPTSPDSGAEKKRAGGGSSVTAEDTARNLSAAIQLSREKKKTRSQLEKKRQEQLAHVEKDRALLRDSLIWTENVLRSVATLARKADAVAEGVTDEFFKDVHFSAIPLEDLPLALQPNISAANMAATVNCPVHCDPTICDNVPSGLTQCLKVDYGTSAEEAGGVETTASPVVKRRHTCLPFENPAEYRCPSQSDRCSMVSPRKRVVLRLPVSTPSANKFHKVVVEGYNMHPCIKILLLPAGVRCDRETVPSMVAATGRVMGFGGTTAFPEVYEGRKAVFSKVEILEPGTFDVCLLQFAKKPKAKTESTTTSGTEGVVVLTTTSIGKIVAVPASEWSTVAPTSVAGVTSVVNASVPNSAEPLKATNATKAGR